LIWKTDHAQKRSKQEGKEETRKYLNQLLLQGRKHHS